MINIRMERMCHEKQLTNVVRTDTLQPISTFLRLKIEFVLEAHETQIYKNCLFKLSSTSTVFTCRPVWKLHLVAYESATCKPRNIPRANPYTVERQW